MVSGRRDQAATAVPAMTSAATGSMTVDAAIKAMGDTATKLAGGQ